MVSDPYIFTSELETHETYASKLLIDSIHSYRLDSTVVAQLYSTTFFFLLSLPCSAENNVFCFIQAATSLLVQYFNFASSNVYIINLPVRFKRHAYLCSQHLFALAPPTFSCEHCYFFDGIFLLKVVGN